MPERPEIPRRRHPTATKPKAAKKLRRRRCDNCGDLYPLTKPTRKFCKEQCRKEFHRYGAAYGPLKAKLEKLIWQSSHDREKRLAEKIQELRAELLERIQQAAHGLEYYDAMQPSTERRHAVSPTTPANRSRIHHP